MNLIGSDINMMRDRYDEALSLQGIPAFYQYPIIGTTNNQGESVMDFLSPREETNVFFDSAPKAKTYKRLGWVVENDKDLPFLIHCSFHLQKLQRDCVFTFAGMYTGLPERSFRVTEITYDIQCPDHIVCQIVPIYDDKQLVGQTKAEREHKFNKSNTFIKKNHDYRGEYIKTKEDMDN